MAALAAADDFEQEVQRLAEDNIDIDNVDSMEHGLRVQGDWHAYSKAVEGGIRVEELERHSVEEQAQALEGL